MPYDAPGHADDLPELLLSRWNELIQASYETLRERFGSRFFSLAPTGGPDPVPIQWPGSPAEPQFCLGTDIARQLSDWGVQGRHALHNEYCEYHVLQRMDASGRLRPKRVQVTTELREYWLCLAMYAPDALQAAARDVLGFAPEWQDLYGVDDPAALTPEEREIRFSTLVAGNGQDRNLSNVPAQPTGRLNNENLLFMTHPINGLDDLLYIVMFGARPFASRAPAGGQPAQPATREQIFRAAQVEHLACRHADPAAAMGAYGGAFEGRTVSMANPLGMYLQSFAADQFLYQGDAVPPEWVRWGRGREPGRHQRLEFGPPDDSPAFLDDITVAVGPTDVPVTGGYQVVDKIEVGPYVLLGPPSAVAPEEYEILTASADPITCREAQICDSIRDLKRQYDRVNRQIVVAPRVMGTRDA